MKSRSLFFVLAATALTLSSIAVTGLFWIFSQSPLTLLGGGVTNYPQASIFVSKEAPIVVSLLANPEKLEALSQLSVPISQRRESHQEWQELKTNLLAQTGLDYQQDLRPWLGEEVTLAVNNLDYDRNEDNGVQPGYLLAVETKNQQLTREFLQIAYSKQAIANKIELAFEQDRGANLIYQRSLTSSPSKVWASAIVGDFVLFANYPEVLREAINNVQAVDLNLAHADYYQNALATIAQPRIGLAFVNLPSASAWIGKSATSLTPEIEQMLTLTLSLHPQGLVAQTALVGVESATERSPALSAPVGALNYLPSDSIVAIAGTNLNEFWQEIQTGLNPASPLAQFIYRSLINLQTPLKIDFSQDIFPWVEGEYALALVPDLEARDLEWLFIAEKTPNFDSKEIIAKLDRLAQEQGLSVGNFAVGDEEVTAWTKLKTSARNKLVSLAAEVKGAHLDTEKYLILAQSISTISKALSQTDNSLLQQPNLQNAIASLPTDNDGYFYVDWERGKPLFEQKLPLIRVVELAAQSFFSHLKSFTLSSQGSENIIRRATIFFNLDFAS